MVQGIPSVILVQKNGWDFGWELAPLDHLMMHRVGGEQCPSYTMQIQGSFLRKSASSAISGEASLNNFLFWSLKHTNNVIISLLVDVN